MKIYNRFFLLTCIALGLQGCISGPPANLKDDQVMWLEVANIEPITARDLTISGIEKQNYSCFRKEFRKQIAYSCTNGSTVENSTQVKGHCRPSPTNSNNSVCDVFLVSIEAGLLDYKYSKPESLRLSIEDAVLTSTRGKRIERPISQNSWFYVDATVTTNRK